MSIKKSEKNIYAAILAGGSGTRMNSPTPKQFLMLGGLPVFIHSVKKLLSDKRIKELWIGANGDWFELAKSQLAEFVGDNGRVRLCEGGADREATMLNTLNAIRSNNVIGDGDIVLIHDAVRPFVTARIINDVINEMDYCDACNTVVPVNDTIVKSSDGRIIDGMPPRKELFAGQSPQGFKINKLFGAFEALNDEERKLLTETTKVCFLNGIDIHIVKGEFFNFKITTPYDLRVAESIISFAEENG